MLPWKHQVICTKLLRDKFYENSQSLVLIAFILRKLCMFIVRAGTPYSPTSGQLRLSFMRLVDVYIHLIRWLHVIRADILRVAWYFFLNTLCWRIVECFPQNLSHNVIFRIRIARMCNAVKNPLS